LKATGEAKKEHIWRSKQHSQSFGFERKGSKKKREKMNSIADDSDSRPKSMNGRGGGDLLEEL